MERKSANEPEHFPEFGKPHLDPLYDRPEFICRNVIRKYGGWWNGSSADVLPAPRADQAREIVALAGGVDAVVARARALADSDPRLASHLAEWAFLGQPDSKAAQDCVIDIFGARAETEVSLMGRGILSHAVRTAQKAQSRLEGGE